MVGGGVEKNERSMGGIVGVDSWGGLGRFTELPAGKGRLVLEDEQDGKGGKEKGTQTKKGRRQKAGILDAPSVRGHPGTWRVGKEKDSERGSGGWWMEDSGQGGGSEVVEDYETPSTRGALSS